MNTAIEPAHDRQQTPRTAMPEADTKSDFTKQCAHCGKRAKMRVVKDAGAGETYSPLLQVLLKIFSPGGVELNKRYECSRCGYKFNEMTIWEVLAAPMALVGFIVLSLLVFLWFVFRIVPRQ